MTRTADPRLDRIVEVLVAYARQDFSARLDVSERLDDIDAIATGINLLAEELDGEVASRRELVAALASLESAQVQLVAAEKLAAVGQLASGVAHELNNPSTWVLLGLDLAQRQLASARSLAVSPSGDHEQLVTALTTVDDALADVRIGVERIRTVIADLGMLSRGDADAMSSLDLDTIVRTAVQFARPAYLSVARLDLDLGGGPAVLGDPARLGQVVTNLIVNAAHALADGRADTNAITVRTLTEGRFALLVVEDNGPGIPPGFLERVFEPYFTTKPADVGTGLGLALVRRIAERHGGSARAMVAAHGGARIEVRIPLASAVSAATAPGKTTAHAGAATTADTGTTMRSDAADTSDDRSAAVRTGADAGTRRPRVLVIDDEALLLKTLELALVDDCDVVTSLGGDAALALLASDRQFDVVICDLQMPKTDGAAVHAALETWAPELVERLVIMSGGAVTPRARQFLERVQPRVLAKPLVLDAALDIIRAAAAGSHRRL